MNIFPVGSTVADERNDISDRSMNIFQVDGMRLGARCNADRSRNIFRVDTVLRRQRWQDRSKNIFQVDGVRSGARCGSDRSRNIFRAGGMQPLVR